MRVERVQLQTEFKLGKGEYKEAFIWTDPTDRVDDRPIPAKAGIEIHLCVDGEWVLVRETFIAGKEPPEGAAALLIPRERVKHIQLSPANLTKLLKGAP
jgi:hypothetical protein